MPQDKPKISFYADPDVFAWWETRPQGDGGRILNELVRQHLLKSIQFSVISGPQGWRGQAKFPNGCFAESDYKEDPTAALQRVSELVISMMKHGQIDANGDWIKDPNDDAQHFCFKCAGPKNSRNFDDLFEIGKPGHDCSVCGQPALYRLKSKAPATVASED